MKTKTKDTSNKAREDLEKEIAAWQKESTVENKTEKNLKNKFSSVVGALDREIIRMREEAIGSEISEDEIQVKKLRAEKKKKEEEEMKKKMEEEKRQEEQLKKELEKKQQLEEARRKKEEEEIAKKKAEEARRIKEEEEARRKQEELKKQQEVL